MKPSSHFSFSDRYHVDTKCQIMRSYLKANEKEILEMLREEALANLTNLKIQIEAVRRWNIMVHIKKVFMEVRARYF